MSFITDLVCLEMHLSHQNCCTLKQRKNSLKKCIYETHIIHLHLITQGLQINWLT